MRNLEEIEKDLAEAREAFSEVEGRPAEVYSRIVGYYRSVRNWNRGKREEYGERKLFRFEGDKGPAAPVRAPNQPLTKFNYAEAGSATPAEMAATEEDRLLLFVRQTCPACPGAKAAASRLGIPVDLVNADTEDGMAEAVKRQVFSTPTAILLSPEGKELGRALDAGSISKLIAL
jgi:ribonucleoside-triphosphate reductase